MSDPRRLIPSVDALLDTEAFRTLLDRFPRKRVTQHIRVSQDAYRDRLARGGQEPDATSPDATSPAWWAEDVAARLEADDVPSLRSVINATGVVLHTNLGRAPLAPAAVRAMARAGEGYTNLEYDLAQGRRGSRYHHCAGLLAELSGAEAALVVNNAAAALVLALNTIARRRGIIVSRGELVEIGGGFRIPDILERSGAHLVEVGSTNRTRIQDYEAALADADVAGILKVHRSNFRMSGFTEEASISELAEVAGTAGIPLLHDLGSGLFADPALVGLPPEPRASESLAAGSDLVVVSGDKLFGGPQAGLLLGREGLVAAARSNPLCRALRVDKVTLAGLEATARLYRDSETALDEIPTLKMLREPETALKSRAEALAGQLASAGVPGAEVVPSKGAVGGGTYPEVTLSSWAVALPVDQGADALATRLRSGDPPVVARIEDHRVLLDVRTVPEAQVSVLVRRVLESYPGESS